MDDLLAEYLRKFVVVFFDDILVYSGSIDEYVGHLTLVVSLLQSHSFYLREKKCNFGLKQLAYLGYIITADEIRPNLDKIEVVKN